RRRTADVDRLRQQRSLPAEARAALDLAQLAPQPGLAGLTVIQEDGVAGAEALFMILARLGLVLVEQRQDDFEAPLEEEVLQGPDALQIGLVADQVDAGDAPAGRHSLALGLRLFDRCEPAVDPALQVFERDLQELGAGV